MPCESEVQEERIRCLFRSVEIRIETEPFSHIFENAEPDRKIDIISV